MTIDFDQCVLTWDGVNCPMQNSNLNNKEQLLVAYADMQEPESLKKKKNE